MTKIVKRYISQDEIKHYCLNIVSMMWADDFKPDIIVGITRGGLWPAMMLSHYLNIKMHTLDVRLRDGDIKENAKYLKSQMLKGSKILIVDDIYDTGTTMNKVIDFVKKQRTKPSPMPNVLGYCLFGHDNSDNIVYTHEHDGSWIVFPWEYHESV